MNENTDQLRLLSSHLQQGNLLCKADHHYLDDAVEELDRLRAENQRLKAVMKSAVCCLETRGGHTARRPGEAYRILMGEITGWEVRDETVEGDKIVWRGVDSPGKSG